MYIYIYIYIYNGCGLYDFLVLFFVVATQRVFHTRLPGVCSDGRTESPPNGYGFHYYKLFTLLDLCVSSLRRGHANLLCIVPMLTDDPQRESEVTDYIILYCCYLLFETQHETSVRSCSFISLGLVYPLPRPLISNQP